MELCDQLSKLVKLKSFYICEFSELGMLPDAIQSMVHLEKIWVFKCEQIKVLPSFITLFSKLKVVGFDDLCKKFENSWLLRKFS